MMDSTTKMYLLRAVLGLGVVLAAWLMFCVKPDSSNAEPRYEVLIPCAVAILFFAGGQAIVPDARGIEEREEKVAVRESRLREERKTLDEKSSYQKAEDQKLRNEERRISTESRQLESEKAAVAESMRANEVYAQKLKKEKRRLAKEQEAIAAQQGVISNKEREFAGEREQISARELVLHDRESGVRNAERKLENLEIDKQQQLQALTMKINNLRNELEVLESQKSQKQSEITNMSSKTKELDDREGKLLEKQELLEDDREDLRAKNKALEKEKIGLEDAKRSLDSELAAIRGTKDDLKNEHEKLLRERQQYQAEVEDLASRIAKHAAEQTSISNQLEFIEVERRKLASEQEQVTLSLAKATSLEEESARREARAADDLRITEAMQSEIKQFFDRTRHSVLGERSIEPTIESLQADAISDPNAAMILANVQLLGAANGSEQTRSDFNQLVEPLRGIGRFLAIYLRGRGMQPTEVIKTLTDWAAALNAASDGRYEIMVPSKDETFRGSSMQSQEDGIDQVSEVLNWAVSNDRSIIAHRAEVL